MPKFRRLSGEEVIAILQSFGFEVVRIKGSHHHLRRLVDNIRQNLTVPVHGRQSLALGTLKAIYRQAAQYIDETELNQAFYADYRSDDDE
jgi:predicted RNA binding protein YcfA (HicA-like mRNA interferase family)